MLSDTILDAMLASGCNAEQIVAVVKADKADEAVSVAEAAECRAHKRADNAERQQRFREQRKARKQAVTQNNADNALRRVIPPNDIYSTPPVSSDEETGIGLDFRKPTNPRPAKPRPRPATLPRPDDVSPAIWADFCALRQSARAPLSATALANFRREAEAAGWSLEQALGECLARGWRGFKAAWVAPEKRGNASHGPGGAAAAGGSDFLDHLIAQRHQRQTGPPPLLQNPAQTPFPPADHALQENNR